MNRKSNCLAVLAVSAVGICLIGCLGIGLVIRLAPGLYRYSLEKNSLKVGNAAPDFELASVEGETVRLSRFRGRPVLLCLAASWCPDCRAEAPLLQELHENQPQLVVLVVDSRESPEVVRQFAHEFGLTHPLLLDRDGAVSDLYHVFAIPTVLFIDAQGLIQAQVIEGVTHQLLAEKLPLIGIQP